MRGLSLKKVSKVNVTKVRKVSKVRKVRKVSKVMVTSGKEGRKEAQVVDRWQVTCLPCWIRGRPRDRVFTRNHICDREEFSSIKL